MLLKPPAIDPTDLQHARTISSAILRSLHTAVQCSLFANLMMRKQYTCRVVISTANMHVIKIKGKEDKNINEAIEELYNIII